MHDEQHGKDWGAHLPQLLGIANVTIQNLIKGQLLALLQLVLQFLRPQHNLPPAQGRPQMSVPSEKNVWHTSRDQA